MHKDKSWKAPNEKLPSSMGMHYPQTHPCVTKHKVILTREIYLSFIGISQHGYDYLNG